MAAVSQLIGSSPFDGTSISLNYDDQTLLATSLTFVVSKDLGAPLTVNAVIQGVSYSWQCPPSSQPGQYTFSPALQGTRETGTDHGMPFTYISWGITQFMFGTLGVNPVPGNQVIHVTPGG